MLQPPRPLDIARRFIIPREPAASDHGSVDDKKRLQRQFQAPAPSGRGDHSGARLNSNELQTAGVEPRRRGRLPLRSMRRCTDTADYIESMPTLWNEWRRETHLNRHPVARVEVPVTDARFGVVHVQTRPGRR